MNPERYTYRIFWSEEDNTFIAQVLELSGITAHGDTSEEALAECTVALGAALEWMADDGEPLPKPFSARRFNGRITVRTPQSLHRELVVRAAQEGVSLNQYLVSVLGKAV